MATYQIDASHSEVRFKLKHLMISTATGNFTKFHGTVTTNNDDDFTNAKVSFSAEVNSISTNLADRDGHLKSPDFFDMEKFPTIDFSSTEFKKISGNNYTLSGNLTIKGITQPVELNVEFLGTATDPWGNSKAGFEVSGKINRTNFGLTWNTVLEAGGVLLSEEVKLQFNIQLLKQ